MSLWCITKSEFNILNRLYCEVDVARRKLGIGIQWFHIVWNRYELWCLSNMTGAAYGTGYAYLPTYIPVITLGFMRVPTVQALVFSSVLWFFYVSSVLMLYKCNKCACLVRVSVRWVCSFLYGCPPPFWTPLVPYKLSMLVFVLNTHEIFAVVCYTSNTFN